uniref:Aminotransferase class IV n=1 Tax=Mucochytrium quahogii TaxID=96639 RepID=A0A7S2W3Z3_9STRA|mmetsp:Transcript_13932/g.24646  ORF Transcript_13932/g.24646 Transcript_13932/m.24646 type:complete len:374 (+) Transcript_13932:732-1853(+)
MFSRGSAKVLTTVKANGFNKSTIAKANTAFFGRRMFSHGGKDDAMKSGVGGAVFGDPKNENIRIYMNTEGTGSGRYVPREQAMVSVFDSGFILGDGVWEGLRMYNGKWLCLDKHLQRLYEACKYMDINIGVSPKELERDLQELVNVNGMKSGCHARLMVTRGEKYTPYQGPAVNKGPATIVCIAEHKPPATIDSPAQQNGIKLHTVHVRRGYADVQDQKLNSHSKINCVTACIAAKKAGADEGLMLDPHGQVATCNSVHFFIVRNGEVWTSGGNYCIPGITRGNILELCRKNGIPAFEKDFSLYECYGAQEAFVTGTFGGITPVSEIDGRQIGCNLYDSWNEDGAIPSFEVGPMTRRLQSLYNDMVIEQCGGL